MEYQLEIYRPGSCDNHGCIKVFTSAAPFLPIRVGDLLNATYMGEGFFGMEAPSCPEHRALDFREVRRRN